MKAVTLRIEKEADNVQENSMAGDECLDGAIAGDGSLRPGSNPDNHDSPNDPNNSSNSNNSDYNPTFD
jgi:hypothetical protein